MDKLKSSKGGTLLEIVLILTVVFGLTLLWMKPNQLRSLSSNEFISSLIHTQMMALYLRENIEFTTDVISEYPIRFNGSGNVNMGQTISFGRSKIVIMLGTGRVHEKRVHDD